MVFVRVIQFLSAENADDVCRAESAGGLQDCTVGPPQTEVRT